MYSRKCDSCVPRETCSVVSGVCPVTVVLLFFEFCVCVCLCIASRCPCVHMCGVSVCGCE